MEPLWLSIGIIVSTIQLWQYVCTVLSFVDKKVHVYLGQDHADITYVGTAIVVVGSNFAVRVGFCSFPSVDHIEI